LAAEGKAPRTIRNYTEAVHWFAAAYLLRETRYGASARAARARRTYDRIMEDSP
jgi:hypothetical protein